MRLRELTKKAANRVPTTATIIDYVLQTVVLQAGRWQMGKRHPGKRQMGTSHLSPDSKHVERIRKHGYALVEGYLSPAECDDCIRDIEWMLEHKTQHVVTHSDRRIFGAEELSSNIARFSSDPWLNELSNSIVGVRTANAFTLANKISGGNGNKGSGEGWHKDSSFRQFKAILYLNDVNENNGPFQLIEKSHELHQYLGDMRAAALPFRQLRIKDEQMERVIARDPARLKTICAPRGTLILVDTASIHRGRPATEGARYALTNYYVERHQLTPEFARAYSPVAPEKIVRLRETWT